jgi:hypothetical protein
MKKTILIVALVVLALGALGVGVAFAQGGQPPAGSLVGPMMQNGGGYLHTYMVAAVADKLGLTVDEVNTRIAAGETMYDIAIAEGITAEDFPTFMTDVRAAALDAAVKDGVITQEQADWMKSRGFGRGGMMGGQGFTGTCPMYGSGQSSQFGPGMMRGWRWQNQTP